MISLFLEGNKPYYRNMVAQLCTNKEMCILRYHVCYFVHPLISQILSMREIKR